MNIKHTTLLTLTAAVCLAVNTPTMADIYADADDDVLTEAGVEHGIGAGTGALIGGIAGGPPGILIGGFIGGLFGEQAHLREKNLDLRGELAYLKIQVASLRKENQALAEAPRASESAEQAGHGPAMRAGRPQPVSLPQSASPSILYPPMTALAMTVQFRLDSDRLESHFESQIRNLAKEFKNLTGLRFELQGYADRLGEPRHNQDLSQRRVKAVADSLLKAGWPRERLILKSFGEQRPITLIGDTEAYPFDRRVLIRLRAGGPSA